MKSKIIILIFLPKFISYRTGGVKLTTHEEIMFLILITKLLYITSDIIWRNLMLITLYLRLKSEFNGRLGVYLYHWSPLWLRKTTIKRILDCCSAFLKEKLLYKYKFTSNRNLYFELRFFIEKSLQSRGD